MPASRSSMHRSSGPAIAGDNLKALISFALIGFANTVLPFIIFSATYLIIPYSRPVVLLVEILPALATKLVLPHLLYNVSYRLRPIVVGVLWVILAFVASVTAPNVEPPARIITTALASATAAATEVSFLGLTRYYGKVGLAGWGIGTGLGSVVCAVLPFVLTVTMGIFLRDAIVNVYFLAAMVVLVYLFLLPGKPTSRPSLSDTSAKSRLDARMEEANNGSAKFHGSDPRTPTPSFLDRLEKNAKLAVALMPPYMLPLFCAFVAQGLVFPAIARAQGTSPAYAKFPSYAAFYGLAFQLGNLLSRSSILYMRFHTAKPLLIRLGVATLVLILNTVFLFVSLPLVVFLLAFGVGLITGAIYINTFSAALEDKALKLGSEREFSLGVIGFGEAAGMLLGSLVGVLLEAQICRLDSGESQRWCHVIR